ncbi:MAG: DUF3794 domain-containing protein [Clostridia bacterium]|nr:DUF3794 domain-containing protein [Clostridia bacterium]
MAFEKNSFLTAKKVVLNKGELSVECNVATGANCIKILTVQVDACVQNQEVLDKMVTFAGVVDVRVVFMTGEGEICTVNSSCPYSSKFEGEQIAQNACALINVDVIDATSEIVGDENVRVNVILSQSGFVVSNQENLSLRCDDDDVCYQNEEVDIVKYIGCGKDSMISESDINLRDNIKKILLTESKAMVKSAEAGANYVTVSGDVISRVLYVSENDKFESGYIYDTFKQEVELAGTTRDSSVEGYASICQEGVVAEVVQDEKGGKLVVKVPINFNVFAYENTTISTVKDLYSTKADVNITMNSFEMTSLCDAEIVEGKIEGSLTIDEDKPRVDKLLFSGANKVSVTNNYIKDGEIFIEGIAQTTVVYLNDETSSLYSVVIDVPFVISDKTKCGENASLSIRAIVTDADVVVKKGRELIYDAKIKAAVNCCKQLNGGVISEASFGEEYQEKNYAMEVIFARAGKELWDVAKGAHVKEEVILAQNPEVTFPVEKDTPLVLFYQRTQL